MTATGAPPDDGGLGGRDDLAEVLDSAMALHGVNVRVTGVGRRVVWHAGHVLGATPVAPGAAADEALAAELLPLVRAWLTAAAPLRPYHELRLRLGTEQPDGSEPDRITFEWSVEGAPPRSTVALDAFVAGAALPVPQGYPTAALEALRAQTRALVAAARGRAPSTVAVEITTRLLEPADR